MSEHPQQPRFKPTWGLLAAGLAVLLVWNAFLTVRSSRQDRDLERLTQSLEDNVALAFLDPASVGESATNEGALATDTPGGGAGTTPVAAKPEPEEVDVDPADAILGPFEAPGPGVGGGETFGGSQPLVGSSRRSLHDLRVASVQRGGYVGIDGGRDHGVMKRMTFRVMRGGSLLATLEIQEISARASIGLIQDMIDGEEVRVGDRLEPGRQ